MMLLILAVAGPLLILAGLTAWGLHRAERERAEAALVALAHGTALLVDREFAAAERVLTTLATSGALARRDLPAFEAEMRTVAAASGAQAINLIAPDRRVVRSTRLPVGPDAAPVFATGPALQALATGRTVIGNLFVAPLGHAGAVGIAVPVLVPGSEAGTPPAFVLGFLLQRQRLLATLTEQRLPLGAVAVVLDREHTIVARTRRDSEAVGTKPSAEVVAAMRDGAAMVPFTYTSLDGIPVVSAYAQAPETGYWAKLIVPAERFEAPLRMALWRTAILGGLLLAASLLIGLAMARQLAASLRRLGDADGAPLVGAPPELNDLASALNRRMARSDRMAAELRALFDGSPVGMVRSDAGGRVLDANDAFLGIVGMTRADLTAGRVRWDHLTPPEWIGRDEDAIAEAMRLGGCAPYQKEYVRPDGSRVPVLTFFAFTDAATGAAAAFVVDLSAWTGTEAALALAHEQMRLAIGAARMFFWDWNIVTGAVEWSEGLEAACGLAPGSFGGTADAFRALIHPDDQPRVEAALGRALDSEAPYDTEFRMLRADGGVRWVVARGTVQRDGAGRPVRMVGIDFDITDRKAAEAARQLEATQAQLVQDATGIGRWDWDLATGVTTGSAAYYRLYGLPPDAPMPSFAEWLARVHPADRDRAGATAEAGLATGGYEDEFRILRPDGEVRWLAARATTLRDAAGRPVRFLGINIDITDRKQAELALQASEERFRSFAEASRDVIYSLDLTTGRLDFLSPAFETIWGEPRATILGDLGRWAALLHPEDRAAAEATMRRLHGGEAVDSTYRIIRATDGEVRYIRDAAVPIRDAAGQVVRVSGLARDVTARIVTEQALAANRASLQRALDELAAVYAAVPVGLAVVDRDFRFRHVNDALARINGQPVGELVGRTVAEILPDLWPALEPVYRAALRGEATHDQEFTGRTAADPQERRWLASYQPVRDAAGAVWGVGVVVQDVTERDRAAAELTASEARFRSLAEAMPAFVFVTDPDGQTSYVNAYMSEFVGRPADSLLGGGWAAVLHPDDRVHVVAAWQHAVATGTPFEAEYRFLRHDGVPHWFLCRGVPKHDGAGRILRWVGTCTDIDSLRRAEAALDRAEEQLGLAIHGANIGSCSWDLRTNLVSTSPRMCELHGLPEAPAVEAEVFLAAIHPEDRPVLDAALSRALTERVEFRADFRIRSSDDSLRWRRAHGRAEFGPDGAALALHGVVLDIDAEKQAATSLQLDNERLEALVAERTRTLSLAAAELTAEMRRREDAQAALIEAQKLEALGQLTSGVAHDFNNVLAAVIGSLRLIQRRAEGHAQIGEFARAGISAAERAAGLIRQLMAFARREDQMPVPVAPAAMLAEARDLLQQAIGAGVRLELDAAPGIWPVLVDPHRLEVALLNLAVNARDAMAGSGTLHLAVRNLTPGDADPLPPGTAAGQDYVAFRLRDTGPGMPPEVLARATEAFFTTKPRGHGTGLGLAMVRGFVQDASGSMRITSPPGEGTLVEIWLPRALDAVGAPADPDDQEDPALHGDATVLVVDDDPGVRLVTATLLRDMGYEVLEASGADAAMVQALVAARLDLVVTDVTMPGGDGPDLVARLHAARPGVPAIYVSGYADRYPLEAKAVLSKPFTPAELGIRVLRALGRVRPQDRLLARLRRPELREAYVVWRRLVDASGGVLPRPEAFDLTALDGAAQAFRVAVEGTADRPAFRFLALGAALAGRSGRPMEGEIAASDTEADEVLGGLAGVYERCARFGVPCHDFARYDLGDDAEPVTFERLVLPLAAEGTDRPTQLVGIAYFFGSL
ncbi:PAS domain-containing protein [Dankookia sp. GCM10030260]|uniref:PAS domain-containing protein n=1 Tax=Dankookia sp. GCM10030260 TaxID=3273390 RepID=UPI0036D3BBF7